VTAIFCLILYIFGVDIMPIYPEDALLAVFATTYLAFAIGFLAAVLYKLMRAWAAVQIGLLILMYFTSGALFMPSSLPHAIQEVIWYNPLLHSVEWLRSAYYDGYSYGMLSRAYLLGFSTVLIFVGLLSERVARGFLLEK
jgi:capsular polysaccharide transport system permease protein